MSVQYKTPQLSLTFSIEDLESMFNYELCGRWESNGFGKCWIKDGKLEVEVEVDTSGHGGGGGISVEIDLSDAETRASLDKVIEQWQELSESHKLLEA